MLWVIIWSVFLSVLLSALTSISLYRIINRVLQNGLAERLAELEKAVGACSLKIVKLEAMLVKDFIRGADYLLEDGDPLSELEEESDNGV